ncbi:MAG TPA: dephospho-CoA kinase, partial [Bacilli bacterium]|nr:dephospho-CoA kinase [Bacilli bacterium]
FEKIIAYFGKEILNDDGTLHRKKLGAIIFNDETKRQALNDIVHPAIRKQMLAEKDMYEQEGHKTIIFDIPLLFEGDSKYLVDKKLLVYVDEETQLKRLLARDETTIEDATSRIASQMPLKDKVALADAVINNNGTIEETKEQLLDVLNKWGLIQST